MTIREAAELLYDEYTGTTGRLCNSTQEARWLAFTEKIVTVANTDTAALISYGESILAEVSRASAIRTAELES